MCLWLCLQLQRVRCAQCGGVHAHRGGCAVDHLPHLPVQAPPLLPAAGRGTAPRQLLPVLRRHQPPRVAEG